MCVSASFHTHTSHMRRRHEVIFVRKYGLTLLLNGICCVVGRGGEFVPTITSLLNINNRTINYAATATATAMATAPNRTRRRSRCDRTRVHRSVLLWPLFGDVAAGITRARIA